MIQYKSTEGREFPVVAYNFTITSDLFNRSETLFMTANSLLNVSKAPLYTNKIELDISKVDKLTATLQKDSDERWRGSIRLYQDGAVENDKIVLAQDEVELTSYMVYGEKKASFKVDNEEFTQDINSGISAEIADDAMDLMTKKTVSGYEILGRCLVMVSNFAEPDTVDVDNKGGVSKVIEIGIEHIGRAAELKKFMKDLILALTGIVPDTENV